MGGALAHPKKCQQRRDSWTGKSKLENGVKTLRKAKSQKKLKAFAKAKSQKKLKALPKAISEKAVVVKRRLPMKSKAAPQPKNHDDRKRVQMAPS